MSIDVLPGEILLDIFSRLPGLTVIKCREVCTRWRDFVDSMPDTVWRIICETNSTNWLEMEYKLLREKHGLTWREAFKTIFSWSWEKVKSAKIGIEELGDNIQYFKVLPHCILACLQNNFEQVSDYSDTVVYYDLETSQKCGRRVFNFPFLSRQYDENEHLMVLIGDDGSLHLVLKQTNQRYEVGNLRKCRSWDFRIRSFFHGDYFSEYTLIKKEVFFKDNDDEMIYVSKLINKDGKPTISTAPLKVLDENYFPKDVVEFCYKNGCLNILTTDGSIYCQEGVVFHKLSRIAFDCYNNNKFDVLKQYGFDWRSRAIYVWLTWQTIHGPLNFNPFVNAFCGHVHLILGARPFSSKIYLYWSLDALQETADLLELFQGKPTKVIDFTLLLNEHNAYKPIEQLDVADDGYSRKIIVLGEKRLTVVEINPGSQFSMKLRSNINYGLVPCVCTDQTQTQSGHKKQTQKKENVQLALIHQNPYNTRSKTKFHKS